jgi:hypothetical protein
LKYQDKEALKRVSASVSWETNNLLSYVFQEKENKFNKLNKRNESIYNYYSTQLTQDKKNLLKKEAEDIRTELDKRNAAFDAHRDRVK